MKNEQISLCCITGNCENTIAGWIEQFKRVADEIVIVRACGNTKPDRTLEIAKAAGCVTGQYFNAVTNDWPHVDNFAKARNKAWSMASHEWVMWADMDDSISPESAAAFRADVASATDGINMIQAYYDIPDIGASVPRERLVRRGVAEWINAAHECMMPTNGGEFAYIVSKGRIVHAAKMNRKPSCERNLRILQSIPEKERTHATLYYIFSELFGLERVAEAIPYGKEFLAHPEAGTVERYEILMQMVSAANEPAVIAGLLHEAHRTDPTRVEALYELGNLELTLGDPVRGLAYLRSMRALPEPTEKPWNNRAKFYTWAGEQIETQAMRLNGRRAAADVLEYNRWKEAGGKISLLHATRGRAVMASRARQMWFDKAANPAAIEHIFVADSDDKASLNVLSRFRGAAVAAGGGCVAAWNAAASLSYGDIMVQVSDDFVPPWNWDQIILDRIGDTSKEAVLAVSDGSRTDTLLCMAILTRKRYDRQGFLFHPDFTGVYSDNYFTDCAYQDGVVIEARDIVFEHNHPAFGKGEMDETYSRQNSEPAYNYGKAVYDKLMEARK